MHATLPVRFALANAVAELIGLGTVAGLAALLATSLGPESAAFGPLVIVLGAIEGAIVGAAQLWAMRPDLPALRARAWILATIAGAVIAWALGMLPSMLLGGSGEPGTGPRPLPAAVELLLAALLGAIAGPVLGGVQALVLHRHVRGAAAWVLANSIAWAAAMPIVFAAAGGMPATGPDPAWIGLALISLFAAGFVVGAIEGLFLERILHQTRDADRPAPLTA